MSKRLQFTAMIALGALTIVAVFVWALGNNQGSGSNSSEAVGRTRHSAELKPADIRQLEEITVHDATVRRITEGGQIDITEVIPWTSEGGVDIVGAEIRIDVQPQFRLTNERLPALIMPGPNAPTGTPDLYRYAVYSAQRVSRLRTLVDLGREKVVEVEPTGDHVEVTKAKLLGPRPGDAYKGDPGE